MKRHGVPPLPHTNPTNLLATPEPIEVDEDEAKRKRKALGKQKSTEKRRQIERDATKTNRIWQEVKKLKIMSNIDDLDALKEYVKNIDTNKKMIELEKEMVKAKILVQVKEDELLTPTRRTLFSQTVEILVFDLRAHSATARVLGALALRAMDSDGVFGSRNV